MFLKHLHITNFKNIREQEIDFAAKINCFIGNNAMGKTNILDAIYLLSFTKSKFNNLESNNITHDEVMCFVEGVYSSDSGDEDITIAYQLHRGHQKKFVKNKKPYPKMFDHIGLIPLVMICPQDSGIIAEGSEERRRFIDTIIAQYDKNYLTSLRDYNVLLAQRNALLRKNDEISTFPNEIADILEEQMTQKAMYIFEKRTEWEKKILPYFVDTYQFICENNESVQLRYKSQLEQRDMLTALRQTRQRDLLLGYTTQGVHKDDIEMCLGEYPLKKTGSQGQQKTFLLAMKLAQAALLKDLQKQNPILLLDDIFDKLDSHRVKKIIELVAANNFGQIFITDTNQQHITQLLQQHNVQVMEVKNGEIS